MRQKTVVVGIAGGSASGKSTLAKALTDYWESLEVPKRVAVLSTDRFVKADKTSGPFFISPSTGEQHFNWNHPDALDLPLLLAQFDEHMTLPEAPDVLLIEGLMVLHLAEIRERLDVRLFVELDADERALRRLLRDMKGGRTFTAPDAIATYYLESARVGHARFVEPSRVYADLIVRGDAEKGRVVRILAGVIEAEL